MSSVSAFSWTLDLTCDDLDKGPLVAVSRCASVAQSLGAHIDRHAECDVMQPIGHARHIVRSGADDVTAEDRAETVAATIDAARTALEAIATQRVAWSRLIDVARVALTSLGAVEQEARAMIPAARDTLASAEAAQ